MPDNKLTITDVNEAAFLEMRGHNCTMLRTDSRKVVFLFPDTLEVHDDMEAFIYNDLISEFVFHLKRTRSRMLELRDGSRAFNPRHYANRTPHTSGTEA